MGLFFFFVGGGREVGWEQHVLFLDIYPWHMAFRKATKLLANLVLVSVCLPEVVQMKNRETYFLRP